MTSSPTRITTLSAPGYPAVLDKQHVEKLLGFTTNELKALIRAGHLLPLGKHRPRTQKRFAAVYILRLREDLDWLSTARDIITGHWRKVNTRARKARLQRRSHLVCSPQTL